MTKHAYSVAHIRGAIGRMRVANPDELEVERMLTAFADLREQIERAKEGITDNLVDAVWLSAKKAFPDAISPAFAIRIALQDVAHLLPGQEVQAAKGETSLMQRIQQRLEWIECGQNIDVAEFCGDVRTLCVQPRVPDGRKMTAQDDALGSWMAAALSDGKVCAEMKRDIEAWMAQFDFAAPQPKEPQP